MKKLLSAILLALVVLTTQELEAANRYTVPQDWFRTDTITVKGRIEDYTPELFHFNGIPHYETITPECRRVRDDLRLNGFYNIDTELRQLKEKLK